MDNKKIKDAPLSTRDKALMAIYAAGIVAAMAMGWELVRALMWMCYYCGVPM